MLQIVKGELSKIKTKLEIFLKIMTGTKIMVMIIIMEITEVVEEEDMLAIIDLHAIDIRMSLIEGTSNCLVDCKTGQRNSKIYVIMCAPFEVFQDIMNIVILQCMFQDLATLHGVKISQQANDNNQLHVIKQQNIWGTDSIIHEH